MLKSVSGLAANKSASLPSWPLPAAYPQTLFLKFHNTLHIRPKICCRVTASLTATSRYLPTRYPPTRKPALSRGKALAWRFPLFLSCLTVSTVAVRGSEVAES